MVANTTTPTSTFSSGSPASGTFAIASTSTPTIATGLLKEIPVDVRERIWLYTLPDPQPVDIGVIYKEYQQTPDVNRCWVDEKYRVLPVALHIHPESRAVAKRNYTVVHRDDFPDALNQEQYMHPICADPQHDLMYLTAGSFDDMAPYLYPWIDNLKKKTNPEWGPYGDFDDKISTLHLPEFFWHRELWKTIEKDAQLKRRKEEDYHLGVLLRFKGLRKVVFIGCQELMPELSKEEKKAAEKVITKFLKAHKSSFDDHVPEVSVEGFRPFKATSTDRRQQLAHLEQY